MILLDKPYVSEFLKRTIRDLQIPVVRTDYVNGLNLNGGCILLDEKSAIQAMREDGNSLVYTTSESSIGWIERNLSFTHLPDKIRSFKDKAAFRKLIKSLHPDLYFQEVELDELNDLNVEGVPTPFVIKPTVGFFSLGVYTVNSHDRWKTVKKRILDEAEQIGRIYPKEVLSTSSFLIEQYIEGDEYAVDAYFNAEGEPVVLSVLHHVFSSGDDVSDRVYTTSKEIIENNIERFTAYLREIGKRTGVRNFPVHVEMRCNGAGSVVPIEINPMRFGGLCTTADLTHSAYGFNPYEYYFAQKKPDWAEILKDKDEYLYSLIVLNNSTGYPEEQIESFDYEKILTQFERPLEVRKLDYKTYRVFGFVFVETHRERRDELDHILYSDLRDFVTLSDNR